MNIYDTHEGARLILNREKKDHWNRWGPFLSERAWGTVREDYSAGGEAWDYFPHEHARFRAYRWNEDGLGGICDRRQFLCFALALWNGKDPILKERMFGLTGAEANHGEDVKEYWYYLDSTPTHTYMKMLYKYPQAAYPYAQLIEENRRRSKQEPEFELVDTGVFAESRYFDVEIEYAKLAPEDILIRINVSNRGPEASELHLLPTLWFRNTWSWGRDPRRPSIAPGPQPQTLLARHATLGDYILYCAGAGELLFTENETNSQHLFGVPSPSPYTKDAFHAYVVNGETGAVNPEQTGTKAAAYYKLNVGAGETVTVELRLAAMIDQHPHEAPFADFGAALTARREEADAFYNVVLPANLSQDAKLVARQAFAGMLWSKQFYHYIVDEWLQGDPAAPTPPAARQAGRNNDWPHLFNRDVISMPDKWEFPWYASWDLGFHCVTLAHVDPQFAKDQILLMLREWYMHPNGQIPAYEWNFDDVNPPVLSLAAIAVFRIEQLNTGVADYNFLERVFHKLALNFTWWVNRKDPLGNDIFEGGFLGMDNIGAFDRDNLPPGYLLGQADGTGWMAAFAKSMLTIALTLAERNPSYEDVASKFWEHFVYIANAMNSQHDPSKSLWDLDDGFFYDFLISPDRARIPVRARTMVGLVPIFAAMSVPASVFDHFPAFQQRREWFAQHRKAMVDSVQPLMTPGPTGQILLSHVRADQLVSMLKYMLAEPEFLSPCGVRSVSRYHLEHPLMMRLGDADYRLDYEPGESTTDLFGGNSNWRGPIWMPVNFILLLALEQYHIYLGDQFTVECPTGSGQCKTLHEVRKELARRLGSIFLRGADGKRRVFGDNALFNNDPYWRDLINFHEYYDGDTGRGCGAAHQTGWSGLIAEIIIRFHDEFTDEQS